jgi:hypothetical protein
MSYLGSGKVASTATKEPPMTLEVAIGADAMDDNLYLRILGTGVAVECSRHPEYSERYNYDPPYRRVGLLWIAQAVAGHARYAANPPTGGEGETDTGAATPPGPELDSCGSLVIWIGPSSLSVRCHDHPQFSELRAYTPATPRIPMDWIAATAQRHLGQHQSGEHGNTADLAGAAGPDGDVLDPFQREIAGYCRLALNDDKTIGMKWPTAVQIAVALVINEPEHLADMWPHGYTVEQAAQVLLDSMPHKPRNLVTWLAEIRNSVKSVGTVLLNPSGAPLHMK